MIAITEAVLVLIKIYVLDFHNIYFNIIKLIMIDKSSEIPLAQPIFVLEHTIA